MRAIEWRLPCMKTLTGYNVLAAVAVVCATLIVALGRDLTFAMALIALAGTISGRGSKA